MASPVEKHALRWAISLVFLVIGLGVAAYRGAVLREELRRYEIVIPAGTAARLAAGDETDAPPHSFELILGIRDVLVIQNEDSVWHQVGPYRVAPGHTLQQRFSRPGTIQAACTITPSQQVEIVVRERERLFALP